MKRVIAVYGTIAVAFFVGLLAFENASKMNLKPLSQEARQIGVGDCGSRVNDSTKQCYATTAMGCEGATVNINATCSLGHTHSYTWHVGCKTNKNVYQSACSDGWGASFGGSTEHGYLEGTPDDCGNYQRKICDTPAWNQTQQCAGTMPDGLPCQQNVTYNGTDCKTPTNVPNSKCLYSKKTVGSGC